MPRSAAIWSASLLLLLCSSTLHAQNIDISFSGFRSNRGQAIIKIYTSDQAYDDDKPIKTVKFPKQQVANGKMTGQLSLEPGTYGFALLDDEDGDTKMAYSMLHIPKEGFAFSNYFMSGMKAPKFHQFRFRVEKGTPLHIEMKMRYL